VRPTVVGPEAGARPTGEPASFPVTYRGGRIGSLLVAGASDADTPLLERVAELVSPYVLVGWDTRGVAWPE
jgi:hypothetical protein